MFAYRHGVLHAEDLSLADLAAHIPTPFYCYSRARLQDRADAFAAAFGPHGIKIYFAIKANSNLAVIDLFARNGFGADIVSGGELQRALAAGIPADRIVYSGVGKSAAEMAQALDSGIHQFNIESAPELDLLKQVSTALNKRCAAVLRVNPDVEAGGHHKISTGRAEDKFGVAFSGAAALFAASRHSPVDLCGLAMHIGSQIGETAPFRLAYARVKSLMAELSRDGHAIRRLDLGGGYGVRYHDETPADPEEFANTIAEEFAGFEGEIGIEPGRALVADAGIIVSRVLYVKETGGRRFVVIDSAMNDLIRPSLYEAWHNIMPVDEPHGKQDAVICDIVGPICETGDTFATDRLLHPVAAGDLVAIMSAGAYGSAMSSTYNSRPLIAEIMIGGSRHAIVRRAVSANEMMMFETMPDWPAG